MKLSVPPRRHLCRLLPPVGKDSNLSCQTINAAKLRRWNCADALARCRRARLRWLSEAVASALLFGFALPARASLGGNVSSLESDRAQMKASVQVTQHSAYEVHEMQMPGGTVVDEYVSPQGTVFAVSWHGQFPPPMQQILGTYFQQYSAALRASQTQPKIYGHRPLNIQGQGLVVQTGGHMRAHSGRAYIPDLLPPGMNVNQIQ